MAIKRSTDYSEAVLCSFGKFCNRYGTCRRALLPFAFNPINLVQRMRRQITLTTLGTANNWHIFDDEQLIAFTITT